MQGRLTSESVELLEAECKKEMEGAADQVCLDLKGLTYLDEAAAMGLCRLKKIGVILEGDELFTEQMIEIACRSATAR